MRASHPPDRHVGSEIRHVPDFTLTDPTQPPHLQPAENRDLGVSARVLYVQEWVVPMPGRAPRSLEGAPGAWQAVARLGRTLAVASKSATFALSSQNRVLRALVLAACAEER